MNTTDQNPPVYSPVPRGPVTTTWAVTECTELHQAARSQVSRYDRTAVRRVNQGSRGQALAGMRENQHDLGLTSGTSRARFRSGFILASLGAAVINNCNLAPPLDSGKSVGARCFLGPMKLGAAVGLTLTLSSAAVWNLIEWYRSYRYVKVPPVDLVGNWE